MLAQRREREGGLMTLGCDLGRDRTRNQTAAGSDQPERLLRAWFALDNAPFDLNEARDTFTRNRPDGLERTR